MKQFGFVHPFYMAFYSKELYRDVALNWRGTCFGHLFVLLLLCWLVFVVKVHLAITGFVTKHGQDILEKVPSITIKNGKVSSDVQQPYILNSDKGQPIAILDTTGKYTSLDNTPATILLTDSALLVRKSSSEVQTTDLSKIKDFSLDKGALQHWVDFALQWATPIIFLVSLPFSFVYRIGQTLIYAAIGTIFVSSLRGTLEYAAVLRLAVLAVIPVIILDTVLELTGAKNYVSFLIYWPLCFGLAMFYLYRGVKAATENPPAEPGMGAQPVEVIPGGFDRPQ